MCATRRRMLLVDVAKILNAQVAAGVKSVSSPETSIRSLLSERCLRLAILWRPRAAIVRCTPRPPSVFLTGFIANVIAVLINASHTLATLGIAFVLVSLSSTFWGVATAQTFDLVQNLSASAGESTSAQIAISGQNVYVLWRDFTSNPSGWGEILFRRSTDGGITFGPVLILSGNIEPHRGPAQIAASGSNVYVVWPGRFANGVQAILLLRSSDGGATFSSPINLSDALPSDSPDFPRIAVSGSSVYVTWSPHDYQGGGPYFRRSTDGGATFASSLDLSPQQGRTTVSGGNTLLAVSGANVYIAWENDMSPTNAYQIFLRRSTDGGATFEEEKNLSPGQFNGGLALSVDGLLVSLCWSQSVVTSADVFCRTSQDGGSNWGAMLQVSDTGSAAGPVVRTWGTNVYVAWTDGRGSDAFNHEILYRRSTDGGITFGPIANLSNNDESSSWPSLVVSGSTLFVVWHDLTPGNWDLLYRRSLDAGATFESTLNLSANPGASYGPQVAVSTESLFLIWEDETTGGGDIFLRRALLVDTDSDGMSDAWELEHGLNPNDPSDATLDPDSDGLTNLQEFQAGTDPRNPDTDGDSFTDGEEVAAGTNPVDATSHPPCHLPNLSCSPGASTGVSLAVAGSNVYVLWQDDMSGKFDVFLRRSTDGGQIFGGALNLSESTGDSRLSSRVVGAPSIAVSGTVVHVVWDDDTGSPGLPRVLYRRSSDGGSTFEPAVDLSQGSVFAAVPQIFVDGSVINVFWVDLDFSPSRCVPTSVCSRSVVYRRSTDGGATFEAARNLSAGTTNYAGFPWIAVNGTHVHVVWSTNVTSLGQEVVYRRSRDAGASFEAPLTLSGVVVSTGGDGGVQVVAAAGNLYVLWREVDLQLNGLLRVRASQDLGTTFDSILTVSDATRDARVPRLAGDGARAYVIWEDASPDNSSSRILIARSTDGGLTIGSPQELSPGGRGVLDVAVAGSVVHVIWGAPIAGGNFEDLFYQVSTDEGQAFTQPVNVSNTGFGASGAPNQRVLATGTTAYVAWGDRSPGNEDIFFQRIVQSPPVQPVLSVTPATLDFMSVAVGDSKDLSFTVTNTGGGTLTGSCTTVAPFSLPGGCTFSLTAGQSQDIAIRFSPTSVEMFVGNVSFTSNGGNASPVVQGEGVIIDTDSDGMPDAWELEHGMNPNDPTDAGKHCDSDGLTNLEEYQLGTDPCNPDTDGDEFTDKEERDRGFNPLDPRSPKVPVLLVHGWCGGPNEGTWGVMGTLLQQEGLKVAYANYHTDQVGDLPALADWLQFNIRAALNDDDNFDVDHIDKVDIVAHSMGGLVTRAFMTNMHSLASTSPYNNEIRRLIMVGTPNYGTPLGAFGELLLGCATKDIRDAQAEQMRYGSEFLWTLHNQWAALVGAQPDAVERRTLVVAGTGGGLGLTDWDGVVTVASAALAQGSAEQVRYVPYIHTRGVPGGTIRALVYVPPETPNLCEEDLYCADVGRNHKTYRFVLPFLTTGRVPGQAEVWADVPDFDEGALLLHLVDDRGPLPPEATRTLDLEFAPEAGPYLKHENDTASTVTVTGLRADPEQTYTVTVKAGGHSPAVVVATIERARTTILPDIPLVRSADPLPDLTGQWLSLTQRCSGTGARRRCQLNGQVQIRNQGNKTAPSFLLRFYLSTDATWDEEEDTILTTVTVGPLQPGKELGKRLSYRLPKGQSTSGQYVIAVIDATHFILESDETNNTLMSGPIP